jgi:hypothetical protein
MGNTVSKKAKTFMGEGFWHYRKLEVFMEKYIGTFIVLAVLVIIVCLVVRSMISDKKKGKSLQCGGDCKHCGGHCH